MVDLQYLTTENLCAGASFFLSKQKRKRDALKTSDLRRQGNNAELASSELAEDVVDRARELVEVSSALRSSSWAVFSKAVKEPSVNPASSQNSEQGQVLDARSCLSTRAVVTSHCGIP